MDLAPHVEPPRLPHDRDNPWQWMTFVLADGRALLSRQVNWRNVPLAAVLEVRFHLKGHEYTLRRADCPATFREFVVFRTGGMTIRFLVDPDGTQRREIVPFNSWTLGWTDGATEYLREFDWKTGRPLRAYTLARDYGEHPTHFHPSSERQAP